jgi:predicted small integral membrane protein
MSSKLLIPGTAFLGCATLGMVMHANPTVKLSAPTQAAIVSFYPLFLLPLGLLNQSIVNRLTDYFTPHAYKKTIKETPERMRSYLFNKRYMVIDILVNQLGHAFFQAIVGFEVLKFLEWSIDELIIERKPGTKGFRKHMTADDWLTLAKIRWFLILGKISGEFIFGLREAKGYKGAKHATVLNLGLNWMWQCVYIQTFLDVPKLLGDKPPPPIMKPKLDKKH